MSRNGPVRIVLAGGGSAGHIEPALAVADALLGTSPNLVIEIIGTESGLERLLVPQRGHILRTIPKVTLPRRISRELFIFPFAILRSFTKARSIIREADCLVGFGGYVSASAYLAAIALRVPIAVHEANARPGWANRLGRHFAAVVAVNFEVVQKEWPGSILTGMPIRSALAELAKLDAGAIARFREVQARSWGFDPSRPIVAVFGGSQGSLHINNAISEYLRNPLPGLQIIHAVGINNPLPQEQSDYLPVPYFHDMAAIYGSSDLLITRSGAVTCSELMTVARSAILVPLAHGNGEQIENAQALVADGRAIAVPNENFTGAWLAENLAAAVQQARSARLQPSKLHLNAANRIAELILEMIEQRDERSGNREGLND